MNIWVGVSLLGRVGGIRNSTITVLTSDGPNLNYVYVDSETYRLLDLANKASLNLFALRYKRNVNKLFN